MINFQHVFLRMLKNALDSICQDNLFWIVVRKNIICIKQVEVLNRIRDILVEFALLLARESKPYVWLYRN